MPLNAAHIEEAFTSREEGIKGLLFGILNLNLHNETSEKSIISVINKLLSTAKGRKEGLEYLNLIINSFSSAIIVENALNWANHCLIKFSDDILRELKLRLLGEIIEVSHSESDFNKKFVSDYMSKVLDNCITTSHVNPSECKAAIKTLTICMKYYPGWFGVHKEKIAHFLLIFLDSERPVLVQAAGLAFHYLQQVGSGGTNGVNHKANFTQNFHKLCRTIHKVFDKLFENEVELFHSDDTDGDIFEFGDDPAQDTQSLLYVNARRIRNIFSFIEIMVKTKFPVAKETKPKIILEVIRRTLSMHKCVMGEHVEGLETYEFSLLLKDSQCTALKLLRLIIIWYKTNCLPFSYMISKIIADSLARCHNCDCFKFDSLYQESTYRALSEWASISRSSLHAQFQSQILECILKDITPVKTQVTLTMLQAGLGNRSQKAKRRAMTTRITSNVKQPPKESSTSLEITTERNSCLFALRALKSLLEFSRLNITTNLLKDLYKSLFDSVLKIQSGKPPSLFNDPHCQVALYDVIISIYRQNTVSVFPTLHTTISILNKGVSDNNRFISEICHRGLMLLETFCQPICPSLHLRATRGDGAGRPPPPPVREVIEVVEIEDENDGNSVDYDASTDEFPERNKPNTHDTSTETESYQVNYPDPENDQSHDKRSNGEEIEVQEIDLETAQPEQTDGSETEPVAGPIVIAPSEDGDSISDPVNISPKKDEMEAVIQSSRYSQVEDKYDTVSSDEERISTLQSAHDNDKISNSCSKDVEKPAVEKCEADSDIDMENLDQHEKEIYVWKHSPGKSKEQDLDQHEKDVNVEQHSAEAFEEKERLDQDEKKVNVEQHTAQTSEEKENLDQHEKEVNDENNSAETSEEKRDELLIKTMTKDEPSADKQEGKIGQGENDVPDTEESPAKKAKMMSEEEKDGVLADSTKEDGDPDASYLEDDSFVDEVKNYY